MDEFLCHFRGGGCILSLLFCFSWKILFANSAETDQTIHYVASDLGLHRVPRTLYEFSCKKGLNRPARVLKLTAVSTVKP